MLTVEQIDPNNKSLVNEFIKFPFRIYRDCPQWVPPILDDVKVMLNRNKHPFYEHSDADFFVARDGGEIVGRIAAMENKPFNKYHGTKQAVFYLYEVVNDQKVSDALFNRTFEWAKKRGLNAVVGPKGFSAFDGYGIQVEGTEHRQMMTMMNYNLPYHQTLVENLGFEKEVDFVSCYLSQEQINLPERIREIARRVEERGTLKVKRFKNKNELVGWAGRIGEAYNKAFVNNWEYYPLSQNEIKFLLDNLMMVADYRLIKIITHNDDVVGFLFAFPDISAALQRAKGNVSLGNPLAIVDLLLEMKRTKWVSGNGVGVLPEFWGRGGNALMYSEIEKTVKDFKFEHAEMTQVAETTKQMRADLRNLGGKEYKNHRVYHRTI
jgi:GNAT superfamily N-acetyltransferase